MTDELDEPQIFNRVNEFVAPNTENTDELDDSVKKIVDRVYLIPSRGLTKLGLRKEIKALIAKECTKAKLDIAKLAAQMAHDDPEYSLDAFAEDLEVNTLRQDKEQL